MCKKGGSILHAFGSKYHCYGCNMDGDPISYLMNTRKCALSEAIMILAAWVGVEFPLPPAEKGEVAAIMDKDESIKEAERLLNLGETR